MSELQDMLEIVLNEARKYDISIISWSKNSYGEAQKGKVIKIPVPIDYDTLGVCFHEIGHIVLNHFDEKSKKLRYIEEYEAEQYAIQKLKEYNYYNKQYEYRAICHVLSKIAQSTNRGHNIKRVPKEIVKWTNLKINKWKKAKKVFIPIIDNVKRKKDIKINYKNR
jgi:predicted metal-dependent peptidase